VTASDANGCTTSGSWEITALHPSFTAVQQFSCSAQDTGTVQVTLTNQFGCDSVVTVVTLLSNPTTTNLTLEACNGESITYNGVSILAGSSQEFVFTAANGCDSVVLVSVLSLPVITYELATEPTCWNASDGSIELTVLGGKEPFRFALNGGSFVSEPIFTGLTGGSHSLVVQDSNGCELVLDLEVPQTSPSALVVEDATINCEAGTAILAPTLLTANLAEAVWTWSDGSHLPSFEADKEGTYTVQVDDGCEVLERDIQVKWDELYYEKELFYVPNSFSPNGDGINDEFRVFPAPHFEVLSFEFRVFDRWGDEQFVTFNPEVGWDGIYRETDRQIDVHVWFLKAQVLVCGSRVVDVFKEGGVTIVK
jgi:gliding motility-associated-like protein